MTDNRFLIIIAHPKLGCINRFSISKVGLRVAAGLASLALLAVIGLAGSYFRQAKENEQLLSQNEVLHERYESLALTSQERDRQVASLSDLAYQISIAYGIQRDSREAEDAFSSDPVSAYHASLIQYDRLQDALHWSSSGGSDLLANRTPSIWPVKGRISSAYGKRLDPFSRRGSFHSGIDISADRGSLVRVTADGFVTASGWDSSGLGNYVKVSHGKSGFSTIYGHLHERLVRTGQAVQRGELIGLLGSSGRTTGAHLHYEVESNGLSVNPYRYLNSAPNNYTLSLAD